ncbi:MAG: class I SAM-dependent methyltransferase [Gammaproteobacteria bacterium]|nr:MAG: class I SAM-dependent methyltransferase [Gammaproteobacteria bacterium]
MATAISRSDARRFYDKFGSKQDRQGFYEDAALASLIELADFSAAESVFELGCGTGRLAERLLSDHLQLSARYVGIDLSSTMVRLARDRLEPFGGRCKIRPSDGSFEFSRYGGPFDRVLSTYVLDLLSVRDIQQCLADARAVTVQGGLLCHAGLTRGTGPISRTTSALWTLVHRVNPMLVGGCRPLMLADLIVDVQWRLIHRRVVVSAGIASEVVIAEAR